MGICRPGRAASMQYLIELLGVGVFAVSGVLAAGRKRLDMFGAVVIGVVTAIGGGTLRDLLLNRHPIFWIADPTYLLVMLGATAVSLSYVRIWVASRQALLVVDALGLAFFTIGGVKIAHSTGHSAPIAVLMGTITGTFGGVLRDVLTAEIPLVLRPGRLYATAAIAGGSLYVFLEWCGVQRPMSALVGMIAIAALRFAAIIWKLELPMVKLPEEELRGPPPV